MATSFQNLIDLNLLTYYDENIKKYIASKLADSGSSGSSDNVKFMTYNTLPLQGQKGILYVTEDSVYQWNGTKYVAVGNSPTTTNATTWGSF